MRKLFLAAGLLLLAAGRPMPAQTADDYLLPREDLRVRYAENIRQRTDALLDVMSRRLNTLEHRYVTRDRPAWVRQLEKDETLRAVDTYSDDRLLADYHRALYSLLVRIEGAYGRGWGTVLKGAVHALRKHSEKYVAFLEQVEPLLPADEKLRTEYERALALTRKAVDGARAAEKAMKDL
ncbi:MAG: hypothetical protein JXQ27_12225 [Acidobacteria bacterium]|nr:hypothetical protein [Acidobacteriota bacterium]